MPVDFARLLSPERRERARRCRVEMERLHGLPDRWLAEALLRMARETRTTWPDRLGDPCGVTYDPNFVWHVVPEVAKRLGATRLLPNETSDPRVARTDGAGLRRLVGVYLQHVAIGRWSMPLDSHRDMTEPAAADILTHAVPNGNPVAFAVDRLHPAPDAGDDQDDWVARHVREISRTRGFEPTPYWSPAILGTGPRHDRNVAPLPFRTR